MNYLFQLKQYLYYLFFAYDEHHIHSPFVFDLYLKTIVKREDHPLFPAIESLRRTLKRDGSTIDVEDFGSGSLINKNKKRKISSIAQNSLKTRKFAELLFRLVKFSQPEVILELGTSLGITSLYQSLSLPPTSKFYSLEGCPQTAQIAKENFIRFDKQIELIQGNIDLTLPALLKDLPKLDFVFFDANHRMQPTLFYFETCLQSIHDDTIFVFDDIYRSKEMKNAWKTIKEHEKVSLTIDLFTIGLVFFRKNQPKQHFLLKF